jgi:hypothetical protein
MKTIIFSAVPLQGVIEIPLLTECKCKIGLASISLPNINRTKQSEIYHEIDISCDQVDSTYLNPKRRLRKICTEKNEKLYNNFEFKNILYFELDFADHKLTFRIKDQNGTIWISKYFERKYNPQNVTLCLQLQPMDDQNDHWIKYI